MRHPLAWVGWLFAALTALSATRNPLHLVLILLCITLVDMVVVTSEGGGSYKVVSPIRFALLVIPLSAAFNALTVHFGDTVLLRLPRSLPVLGGPITVEALVFGALNGLVLSGILAAFTVVNQALSVRALVRLVPRAFYPVAVVVSIGITFVPVTMRQFRQIREAQAVRGHRVRGLRDWVPLFMPLLIGGLERALQLAEAMTARGFASDAGEHRSAGPRWVIATGLAILLAGELLRLVWGKDVLGGGLILVGVGAILAALWHMGRRVRRTTYRPDPWTQRDGAVILSAAIVLVAFVAPVWERTALLYYPYPRLTVPPFDPLIGIATLGLLGPVFVAETVRWRDTTGPVEVE